MSRSKGHNALKAASYRSGQRLRQEPPLSDVFNAPEPVTAPRAVFDYSRRKGVMSSFIAAPKDAPAWAANRQSLWNKAEAAEKRKDAQLAREVVVSLPDIDIFNHLNEQNKRKRLQAFYEGILRRYVRENFTAAGMIADVALHEPSQKNDERHYHAHIMLSMRHVEADGFGAKERSWNDPAALDVWRAGWTHAVNDALKAHKIDGFIDHRTLEARGLSLTASKPLGANDNALERSGLMTARGDYNRLVKAVNLEEHRYLEKLFEHAPSAPAHEILAAIEKAGFTNAVEVLKELEQAGQLLALHSRETGVKTALYAFAPLKERADQIKAQADALYQRDSFALPSLIVKEAMIARGDKLVREALEYTGQKHGFAVIETDDTGHKGTYLSACRQMYKQAGYEVIAVARTNEGKAVFKEAGYEAGVLTYRDMLRRFGERYTGAKSNSKKVIVMDEADQLSPLQDQEIFRTAQKIGTKLIYVGGPKMKAKRLWQSLFGYYKIKTAYKKLREKIAQTHAQTGLIREAFLRSDTLEALRLQKAKYLRAHKTRDEAKRALLQDWFKNMKRLENKRFILCAKTQDADAFNQAIQAERLRRKHLKAHHSKMFTVSAASQKADLTLYWGDMIQFKKSYSDIGIKAGTRARVLIHFTDYSMLELDDGRVIKVDLKAHDGFALGYAGTQGSESDKALEQGYLYHDKSNALDDAPLLYAASRSPVKLFYAADQAKNLQELSAQLLGRRHDLYSGFTDAAMPEEEPQSQHPDHDYDDMRIG